MQTAMQIIDFYGMKPLPEEGGFYVETYRAKDKIPGASLPKKYTGARNLGTAILYLLTPDTFSALHRLRSDEVFHFYLGDPVLILQLKPEGASEIITLGQDITNGERIQATIPSENWQGLMVKEEGEFALLGTTVIPGFEFEDFEPGDREELLEAYPQQKDLILKLTR